VHAGRTRIGQEVGAELAGHVKNILSKLGANDRTHAVTIGLKRGIIAV